MAPRIRCESYFACAEIDKWAPPADIDQLQAALQAAGAPHRIEWYPGVEHGFVFPLRAGIYERAAAERHWERLFSLFDRTLRSGGHEGAGLAPSSSTGVVTEDAPAGTSSRPRGAGRCLDRGTSVAAHSAQAGARSEHCRQHERCAPHEEQALRHAIAGDAGPGRIGSWQSPRA
jgi:hypothetical protein